MQLRAALGRSLSGVETNIEGSPFNAGMDSSGGDFKSPPELNGDCFGS
jgi:hypothetical protein